MTTQDNIFKFDETAYQLIPNRDKRHKLGLMITLADGTCIVESYDDMGRRECDATGKFLTLHIKGGESITFIGEQLDKLMDGLQDEYIKHLYCYVEAQHTIPTPENNPPIIMQIFEGISEGILSETTERKYPAS